MNYRFKRDRLILSVFFLWITIASGLTAEPKPGGKLVLLNSGGMPIHFNSALVSGTPTAIVGTQIFASPLRYDEHWNPQPYLASEWKVSSDGLSVTLQLVKGATFHDGHPITSEDVAFSLMTVKKHHPFKTMFAPVEKVDTPASHTAVIRLTRPHPAILLAMSPALLPIIPKHVYGDGRDIRNHPANRSPVGSGPYRFVTLSTSDRLVVLRKYDGFFIPGRPYLDEVVIKYVNNAEAIIVELERQEAHFAWNFIHPSGIERLRKKKHLTITGRGYEGIGPLTWLAFNLLRKPLDDKRVRQAIAYFIDFEFIMDYLLDGKSRRAGGPIFPDSPFYDAAIPTYPFNPEKARTLLEEAGYPMNADGKRFSLTLDYPPTALHTERRDLAFYLKYQLSRLGIDVRIRKSKTFREWMKRISNWDYDITIDAVYNWGDPVIGVHRTYMSDNIRKGVMWSNTSNYRNAEVDRLLDRAAVELDTQKRKRLYSEFQKIVTDELPVVWINVLSYRSVYNNRLGHPPLSIWGALSPLDEVYWKTPRNKTSEASPTFEDDTKMTLVQRIGKRAIALLQKSGTFEASKVFRNPAHGFLDMKGSGLHVIGFTYEGAVFLDNSGQTKAGIDISGIVDLDGKRLLDKFQDAAQGGNGGHLNSQGLWPHPATHEAGPLKVWCGFLNEHDIVCALQWQ
ncbi:MAG: ABC transporter substrate-binding protein [Proteobacteria bacterium]|nr:ABC transporter substrate-binding protein [Pseudomonadota bacterium]